MCMHQEACMHGSQKYSLSVIVNTVLEFALFIVCTLYTYYSILMYVYTIHLLHYTYVCVHMPPYQNKSSLSLAISSLSKHPAMCWSMSRLESLQKKTQKLNYHI